MPYFHQMLVSHELGGAGILALDLATRLQTKGQPCDVWIPGQGAALYKAEKLGLRSHLYDLHPIFSSSRIRSAAANWKVAQGLRFLRPGLVHVHSPNLYGALRLGFSLSRLKSVVHVHIQEGEQGLRWAFEKPPHLIITCARFLVDHVRHTLSKRYQENQRIVAVPNPVNIQEFYPMEQMKAKLQVNAPPKVPLVLMLANLSPHKGQETAIRASATLKNRGVNIMLWLAGIERGGQGHYTAYLRSLCGELRVNDRVCFLGYRQDAPDLLRAADIFLLPSTHEGLPLSILEAQATKIPVIAAPTAGIPEVVENGRTGFLVGASDVSSYVDRISQLLKEPDLYSRIADTAYKLIVKDYNWDSYFKQIYQLYCDVMNYAR